MCVAAVFRRRFLEGCPSGLRGWFAKPLYGFKTVPRVRIPPLPIFFRLRRFSECYFCHLAATQTWKEGGNEGSWGNSFRREEAVGLVIPMIAKPLYGVNPYRGFRRAGHSSLVLIGILLSRPPFVAAEPYQSRFFPPAHELFLPLQADPTELRFSFQVGAPLNQRGIAHIAIGDYMGLYRRALPLPRSPAPPHVGGAVITRFRADSSHRLEAVDYYGNVPLDIAVGPVSGRFMFDHVSSHLGDDYLREKNIRGSDNSWEALRGILSVHPWKAFRFYGGLSKAVRTKPAWRGRHALQGGMEVFFNNSDIVHWHPYWATDFQSWERSAWNPTWTSQIGIKTGAPYSLGRGISYFIQSMSGPRMAGQFFSGKETIWSVGLRFQLSQAPEAPAVPAR